MLFRLVIANKINMLVGPIPGNLTKYYPIYANAWVSNNDPTHAAAYPTPTSNAANNNIPIPRANLDFHVPFSDVFVVVSSTG